MKIILILLVLMLLLGCMSPYARQARFVDEAYRSGQLTTNEYIQRMNELQALDSQWRANFVGQLQRQQYLYQMQQPKTIYIWR